jgi:putative phosphotransacetylase
MAKVPVGISNRHIFLSQKDTLKLFNTFDVPRKKTLGQEKYYVYEPSLEVIGNDGIIRNVKVIGPPRTTTQVELLFGDCVRLGIKPLVRQSEDIANSPGCVLKSAFGQAEIKSGVIVAARHLHANIKDAKNLGLKQHEIIQIRCEGKRALVFNNVLVRVDSFASLAFHIDFEEANAAGLKSGQLCDIIK